MQYEKILTELLIAKPTLLAGLSISMGLMMMILSPPVLGAGKMATPAVPVKIAKKAMEITATANVFRVKAISDPTAAVDEWGTRSFKKKWKKEIAPLFAGAEEMELRDFFSSTVLWIGRMHKDVAIVGFYNTWIDGLLIVEIDIGGKKPEMDDFCFIAGETWRGENLAANPEKVFALYTGDEILTVALAKMYHVSDVLFRTHYPIDEKPILLPKAIRKIVGSNSEELIPIKARMLYRLQMYRNYLAKDNRNVLMTVGGLMRQLKNGDKNKLLTFLSEQQDKGVAETALMLPSQVRDKFEPYYFGKGDKKAIVALVNPSAPRLIVVAGLADKSTSKLDVVLEVFDLNLSGQFLDAWKGVK